MKAMVVDRSGSEPTIREADLPEPVAGDGQALVEVRAASVNRADLAALAGTHAPAAARSGPSVVGLDAAGVVLEAPPGSGLTPGDRVMTKVGGGLAERVVVDARMPVVLPDDWSFDDGAAAIVALMTAHNALVDAGRLRAGDTVLVTGANSGVGQRAIEVARLLGAGSVIAAVRRVRDASLLRDLGADHVVATGDPAWTDELAGITDAGVHLTVDHVGGPMLAPAIRASAVGGRFVSVGRLAGGAATIDLEEVAVKRLEVIGVTFRTRDVDETAAVVSSMTGDLATHLQQGRLRPLIHAVLPWTEVRAAQALVASDQHLGKVVLQVS
jgi:NADPH:quinone reductase